MTTDYQQTDVDSFGVGNNIWCSTSAGGASISSTDYRDATAGGTAGTGTFTPQLTSLAAALTSGVWMIQPGASSDWAAGTWTLRFEVTVANMNLQWDSAWLCHLNAAGTNLQTIGSVTGLATSLGSTGVKSCTISGSAGASFSNQATDLIAAFIVCSNSAMSLQSFTLKHSQIISSPFSIASKSPAPIPTLRRAHMRHLLRGRRRAR